MATKRVAKKKAALAVYNALHIVIDIDRHVIDGEVYVDVNLKEVDDIHVISREEFDMKFNMAWDNNVNHALKNNVKNNLKTLISETTGFDVEYILLSGIGTEVHRTKKWEDTMSYKMGFPCEPCE